MTYIADFALLGIIALGYIAFAVTGAVILTRIGIGVREFMNRNNR